MSHIITVAQIQQPAPGRKQGKIIDVAGNKWNVWADKLANYQPGCSYDITYKTNQFNGQTFNVIDSAKPLGAMTDATSQTGAFQTAPPPSTGHNVGPAYTQASQNQGGFHGASVSQSPNYKFEQDERSEDIAVLAIIKEWVGKIPVGDTAGLAHALRSARIAWKESKKAPAVAAKRDRIESGPQDIPFNDSIPENFQ